MSDASSVPLDVQRDLAPVSSRWKGRAQNLAGLLVGAVLALLAMAARPSLPGGFFVGFAGVFVATASALALLGSFESRPEPVRDVALRLLAWPLLQASLALAWLWLLLRLAVAGVIPAQEPVLAVAVPAGFLWLVIAIASAVSRLGFLSDRERPLWRRHGLWLLVLSALVYLPMLGNFGLIDPWETHYGEVAREMLARNDWISLWWAQDGWFWSKPVSNFWAQGLSFAAFGVAWSPDQMIQGIASGRSPAPEWAVRLPTFALALVGQQVLYMAVRPYLGRLPAFLGALVLATTPYWYMLAHQSMADMAYVGPLCAAMAFLLLALRAEPEARVATVRVSLSRRASAPGISLSGKHLLLASVLLLVLPQILYLFSRNVALDWGAGAPWRLRLQLDQVLSGSPGNCGLPGNAACRIDAEGSRVALQPAAAALLWLGALTGLLWLRRGEYRIKRLCYLAAWLFVGLSFMGKGAPGLVLVLFTLAGFLVARGRLAEIRHCDVLGFGLLTACLVLPWFVQESLRHGGEFFERLFIHDMYQRAFDHVHDTNKGDDTSFRYYIWQLGYGLFPWSGLAAAGTLSCLGKTLWASEAETRGRGALSELIDVTYFCVLWQLAAFGMFAITGTKFHHYILPLVPAAAVLTGVLLASLLERAVAPRRLSDGIWALGAAVIVALCGRDLAMTRPGDVQGAARFLQLFTYNYARSWPKTIDYSILLWVFTATAALLCLLLMWPRMRRVSSLGLCGLSLCVSAWAVNIYLVQISPHWGQRETISEYYRRRAGPEEPLVAYQLNWKGENFYTGNDVPAFVSSGKRFTDWVEGEKKKGTKVMFFTTEHSRIGTLKRELTSPKEFQLVTNEALNDKFVLARVVL